MYQVYFQNGSCDLYNKEMEVHTAIGNGLKGKGSKVVKVVQPDGSEIKF